LNSHRGARRSETGFEGVRQRHGRPDNAATLDNVLDIVRSADRVEIPEKNARPVGKRIVL
jgi:hypothetical protein